MLRAINLVGLFGFSFTVSWACTAWEQLPVKLFNDAAIGNQVLKTAKHEATWLLKSVCVDVVWIPCPVVAVANPAPCAVSTNEAELHILLSPLTSDTRPDAMGIAIPQMGPRGRAAVFFSRVQDLANSNAGLVSVPHLLGDVMAHEMGHLLLRSSAHSSEGLMRAGYGRSDLKKAAQRQLRFTREQIAAIQRRPLAEVR